MSWIESLQMPGQLKQSVDSIIRDHQARGRYFTVGGLKSFLIEEGEGEPVVCIHGVPASSFLYRKVISELANNGMRGLAFDLPGLGLADRPDQFDYRWSSLSRFCRDATTELGLSKFHLVVHDIGGPIGLMLAANHPDKIASLTILNTFVDAHTFRPPWMMAPFRWPIAGAAWLFFMNRWLLYLLFRYTGIQSFAGIHRQEIYAYVSLLKRNDHGSAFLKIMRSFELTSRVTELCHRAITSRDYPIQILWGQNDHALDVRKHGKRIADLAAVPCTNLAGKHFLQEDNAPAIAAAIARLAGQA